MKEENFYTTQDSTKSLDQMLACVAREINKRKSVYPRWVQEGRMTEEAARYEIECMECVYRMLFRARELQQVSEEMLEEERKRAEKQKELPL